ncbi:MAG: hypothetical protein KGI06_06300, partial [Candidatus Micrarchaeota archaeon]|nr:hypothetical protein [Candidatus Micrarchaeota archaeon]
ITLSLLFFREAVWPHLMLYGISLSLLINGPGPLSIDEWIDTKLLARHKVTQSAPISPAPAE